MSKILGIVQCCKECPHRRYYSAGIYECSKVNEALPKDADIPAWCPLPDHPAHRLAAAERAMDDLQRLPQPLVGFIPQTYGDAIRAGWIKHGDCPSHEWDNRTSAGNARWLLERAGFTNDVRAQLSGTSNDGARTS
jgi:hypothetical protein